jgi:4'-phosphopantetheinyl transferase
MPVDIEAADGAAASVDDLARLRAGEVHVWLARTDLLPADARGTAELSMLSAQERDRASRLRLAADRHRFIAARTMLRTTLSRYFHRAPSAWVFGYNPNGKPHIVDDDPDARALQFNLSHSANMVAVAVTLDRPVGIDIECTDRPGIAPQLVAEAFAATERAHLERLEGHAQRLSMFRYWTLKEAFAKALGEDLAGTLAGLRFDLSHAERIGVELDPDLNILAQDWTAWQWRCGANVLIAVCVRTDALGRPDAVLRRLGAIGDGTEAVTAQADTCAAWSHNASLTSPASRCAPTCTLYGSGP